MEKRKDIVKRVLQKCVSDDNAFNDKGLSLVENYVLTNKRHDKDCLKVHAIDKATRKIARLIVEERGFATYKYKALIQEMANFININALNDEFLTERKAVKIKGEIVNKSIYEFRIPKELSSRIEEIDDLSIKASVISYEGDGNLDKERILKIDNGGSYNSSTATFNKEKQQLENVVINIRLLVINGQWPKHSAYTSLIHELQHAIEDYQRQKNDAMTLYQSSLANYNVVGAAIQKIVIPSSQINQDAANVLYCLWLPHERTALSTSVYSYLKSINSKRENFQKDIVASEVYDSYLRIGRKALSRLQMLLDTNWWFCMRQLFKAKTIDAISQLCNGDGKIDYSEYRLNGQQMHEAEEFKKWFIKTSYHYIDVLMRQIGKVASLYYDDAEEMNK